MDVEDTVRVSNPKVSQGGESAGFQQEIELLRDLAAFSKFPIAMELPSWCLAFNDPAVLDL